MRRPARTPDLARGALLACLAAGFTTLIDTSMVNLAVPSLTSSLSASTAQVQWLLASYSLAFGLALVPAGRVGDLRGRRALFLGGVALFGCGSLVSGLAPAAAYVIVARLLQGVGAGVISSQVLGVIQDLYVGSGRVRALGAYGVAGGLAGLTGPLLGALLVTVLPHDLGWRAVVAASAPLAAVTLLVGVRLLPADPQVLAHAAPSRRVRVDLLGLGLLAVATLALLLPFVLDSPSRTAVAGLVAAAVLALGVFAWWERSGGRRDPAGVILPPQLAGAPGFVTGTLVSTFWFGAQLAQTVVITLFLLDTLDIAPLLAALTLLPSSAAMAATSAVSWRVVARHGTVVISLALAAQVMLLGTLAVALPQVRPGSGVLLLAGINALSGIAGGFIDGPNRAHTLLHSPDGSRGVAAGFLQLAQRLSATVCIAAATGLALSGAAEPTRHGVGYALAGSATLVAAALLVSLRRGSSARTGLSRPPR